MKIKVKAGLLICLLLIILPAVGCGRTEKQMDPEPVLSDAELLELLPERTGYRWVYNGFAEYGHSIELNSISSSPGETTYHLEGQVDDPSGGEAGGDFSLSLDYVVKNGGLYQRRSSPKMMDNFSEMELIRLPLKLDNKWEQKSKHRDGKEYDLLCSITEVEVLEGEKVYTVLYQDKNSDFYEKRRIKENTGVVSFETVWKSNQESIVIGYNLYDEASGYAEETALTALLPPLDQELVIEDRYKAT